MDAEQCLERIRAAEEDADVVQDLTSGVLCLQEREANTTNIMEILYHEEAIRQAETLELETPKEEVVNEMVDEDLADQMGSLVYQRHCNIAAAKAEAPELTEAACNECFEAATHPGSVPSPQEYVASLASCGARHLTPVYEACTQLLTQLAEVMMMHTTSTALCNMMFKGNGTEDRNIGREIFLCFTKVVDMAQIQDCVKEREITGETVVTAGTLLDVMVCNERINDKWVMDHINMNVTESEQTVETTTQQ